MNSKLKFGCYISLGGRNYQEDRIVATAIDESHSQSLIFAIFDGHGGDKCSTYLSKHFMSELLQHTKLKSLPIIAFQETWSSMDEKFFIECSKYGSKDPKKFPADGSTATICLIINNDIYITNCGDSSAYVVSSSNITKLLTEEHGTNNAAEVTRCVNAGAVMAKQWYSEPYPFPLCCLNKQISGKPRVMPGGLLVTRSFGDFYAKKEFLGGIKGTIIPNHGNVEYIDSSNPKEAPKYIIIASDGLWDVLDIKEVVDLIDKAILTTSDYDFVPQKSSSITNSNKITPLVDVESMISSGYINADASRLDSLLNSIAMSIVESAIHSEKWINIGSPADNTSMIIIAFDNSK